MGITAPGKEMAVPSSIQVRLKIIILKEKKLGHSALDSPRTLEPRVEVQPCQAKGILETPPYQTSIPNHPLPQALPKPPSPPTLKTPQAPKKISPPFTDEAN